MNGFDKIKLPSLNNLEDLSKSSNLILISVLLKINVVTKATQFECFNLS
jgi:hypothetical protein